MMKRRFLVILSLFLILMIVSGCDHGIRQVSLEFGEFPRIVYVANVDTELDFSDATIVSMHADGRRVETPFPELSPQWTTIEHNVDFSTPGVYKVKVLRPHGFYLAFFVQVIDEEIFNELSGRSSENGDYATNEEE